MDAINEMSKINEMKSLYPNCTWFRTIRYFGEEKYTDLLSKINCDLSDEKRMKEEYFPSSIEKICTREMSYNDSSDSAIIELLTWGYYLINNYKNEINRYLTYKDKYEKLLFNCCLCNKAPLPYPTIFYRTIQQPQCLQTLSLWLS